MTNSSRPRVNLSTFAEFIVASASGKIGAVQAAVDLYDKDYNPSHDFYRPWREAASLGLVSGDDTLPLRRALADARPAQAPHFRDLSKGWIGVRSESKLGPPTQAARTWSGAEFDVRIRPLAIWNDRKVVRHVAFYLKQEPLTKDGANAMLRLLTLTEMGDYAVLDVRRARFFRPARTARGFDAWLDGEAQSFVTMWRHLRKMAA